MIPLPREASLDVRKAILEALKDDNGYRILENADSEILRRLGFNLSGLVDDLREYLEAGYRLYLLQRAEVKGIKYQCCLRYEKSLVVHSKMKLTDTPEGVTAFLTLSFHKHNTGHSPLPQ